MSAIIARVIVFEPSEEQALIRDTVGEFAKSEIRPRAREADEAGKIPVDVLTRAHELGLVANGLPEEFGGGGERSARTGALVAEELGYGDLSIALAILAPGLLAYAVADLGTAEQKQRLLPALIASPSARGTLALQEPRFDSDPYRPRTTARANGADWILDGAKCLVPWPESVEHVLVIASADPTCAGFLVPRDAAGLRVTPEANLGLRALATAELALENVRVPADARLGGADAAPIRSLIARGRVGLAALAVGVARAACELARDYAK